MGFLFSGILFVCFFSLIKFLRNLFLENEQTKVISLGDAALYTWGIILSQGLFPILLKQYVFS